METTGIPKTWLYSLAVALPLVLWLVLDYTEIVNWLWYHHYEGAYYFFAAFKASSFYQNLLASWPYPVFMVTVYIYWFGDDTEEKDIGALFALLPIAYVPFAVIGTTLVHLHFEPAVFYSYPIIVLVFGYLYVLPWVAIIWVLGKLKIAV